MALLTSSAPLGNDEFVYATPVGIVSTTNGITASADLDDTGSDFWGYAAINSPGVWYSVVVSFSKRRLTAATNR